MRSRAARAYVCGPGAEDALRYCRALRAKGIASAVGLLDASRRREDEARRSYERALDLLEGAGLDAHLSLKAPALAFDRDYLGALARRAEAARVPLHLDSLGPEAADETLALAAELRAHHGDLGLTLPGRWARSAADAERARALGLRVRVVKGHWRDPAGAVGDDRSGFLRVVDELVGHERGVAVATHDLELARAALARLRTADTPCSLELLYGLPHAAPTSYARAEGVPLRVYVAFGPGLLPYSLGERGPRALAWLAHDVAVPGRRGRALVA